MTPVQVPETYVVADDPEKWTVPVYGIFTLEEVTVTFP